MLRIGRANYLNAYGPDAGPFDPARPQIGHRDGAKRHDTREDALATMRSLPSMDSWSIDTVMEVQS